MMRRLAGMQGMEARRSDDGGLPADYRDRQKEEEKKSGEGNFLPLLWRGRVRA